MMGEIGGRGMGYLFENMEKMDIQAERRNTQRERDRADMEKERADSEKERADAAELEIQRLKKNLKKNACNRKINFNKGNQARLKILTILLV